jgi:hypothetical protein
LIPADDTNFTGDIHDLNFAARRRRRFSFDAFAERAVRKQQRTH